MDSFLRQVVALSALWALCELLLPEGGVTRAVRLVVSLLVMTVLLTSLADALLQWTGTGASSVTATIGNVAFESTAETEVSARRGYTHAFLRSQANQAEDVCVRMANRAGYRASAAVYLQESGALERIDMRVIGALREDSPPLISVEELQRTITKAFEAETSRVRLIVGEGEAK